MKQTSNNISHLQILMFWVTDNFLMYKSASTRSRRTSLEQSLLHRVKVQYRSIRMKDKRRDSESDVLLSADEELLDADDVMLRSTKPVVI